jgi:CRP/FNR family transcriptional regulator, cyclic AMP receptor protein
MTTPFTAPDLQALPLFAGLSLEQCGLLLDRHRESSHAADQVFVLEQDWGESLFLLRAGMAKVRTFTPDGVEVVLSVLGEGEVFGEMAALEGAARAADVVALTPVTVLRLRGGPFAALLGQQVDFALALARLEAARLRDLNLRFALQSGDATSRLLAALVYLAQRSSPLNDPQALIPPLAQRELGLLAGLSRETASRTLSKLRSRGSVAEEQGGLRIVDLEPLVKRGLLAPDR